MYVWLQIREIGGPLKMKKLLIAAFLLALTSSLQAVEVDFTGSSCEVTTSNGLYFDNAVVHERSYWMEFYWDTRRNAFRLSDFGQADGCPSMVGEWINYYDWDCNGSAGSVYKTFYADGTWNDTEGYTGEWAQNGCTVDWTYDSGTYYWGEMEQMGMEMAGEMTSHTGLPGCWDADRVNTATDRMKPTATDGDGMDSAGNPR
jgi:hypothetical protein